MLLTPKRLSQDLTVYRKKASEADAHLQAPAILWMKTLRLLASKIRMQLQQLSLLLMIGLR